jgi:hypothetical protein
MSALDFVLWIAASASVALVLGVVWYSPFGFGDTWLEASERQREASGSPYGGMLGSFVATVASALALGVVLRVAGITTVGAGAWLGLLAGVLVAASMLSEHLFSAWPLPLFAIQAGYRITYLVLMGALLAVWGSG